MSPVGARAVALVLVSALVPSTRGSLAQTSPQQPAQAPTFRSLTALVRVDVRVLDREGRPVGDLKQEDFTVLENGVVQRIGHFAVQILAPLPAAPGGAPAFRNRSTPAMQPQVNRVFLIVLGRGRLQGPSNGLDALIHFVRDRLLPQDHVAVLAYNRASRFTNDHEQVAAILERFRRSHEGIETRLRHQLSGLAAIYGSRDIPAALQGSIDALFAPSTGLASALVPPPADVDSKRMTEDVTRGIDAAQRAEMIEGRTAILDNVDEIDVLRAGMTLDDYVAMSTQTMQDMGNLRTGIEYLRYLEGEKHLIFVTEQGMYLTRAELDAGLAARANNARVAIDVIQTGGVDPGPLPTAGSPAAPMPSMAFTAMDQVRIGGSRNIADLTGGQAFFFQRARPAVERLDAATRTGYLIGYYPEPPGRGTRYRRIVVRVNRPGVTVLYRHGYYTNDDPPPLDRRVYLTNLRFAAAGSYPRDVGDIGLTARAKIVKTEKGDAVEFAARIDPARLAFTRGDEQRLASLDVVLYCGDKDERIVGRLQQRLEVKIWDENFPKYERDGILFTATVPVRAEPKFAKAMVYDFASDRVGSVHLKVERAK